MSYRRWEWGTNKKKYLFSIEVHPYKLSKQSNIITSRGGSMMGHYSRGDSRGVFMVMISHTDMNELEKEFDWIEESYVGLPTHR